MLVVVAHRKCIFTKYKLKIRDCNHVQYKPRFGNMWNSFMNTRLYQIHVPLHATISALKMAVCERSVVKSTRHVDRAEQSLPDPLPMVALNNVWVCEINSYLEKQAWGSPKHNNRGRLRQSTSTVPAIFVKLLLARGTTTTQYWAMLTTFMGKVLGQRSNYWVIVGLI